MIEENYSNFITALSLCGNVAVFIKGLPGSGKSTLSNVIAGSSAYENLSVAICETDRYFINEDGEYEFDASKIAEYHKRNLSDFQENIDKRTNVVIVSNTNTQYWEFQAYLKYAVKNNYLTVIIDLYDSGLSDEELYKRCSHGVPLDKYQSIRKHYERDYDLADPKAPWLRGTPIL